MPDDSDRGNRFRVGQHLWHWDADTEHLSTSDHGDPDGPIPVGSPGNAPLRVRLAGIGAGIVVGTVLAVNLLLLGYTGWFVAAVAIVLGVIALWDETTASAVIQTGSVFVLTLMGMLPVTYLFSDILGLTQGAGTVLIGVVLWLGIAAMLRRMSRALIDDLAG